MKIKPAAEPGCVVVEMKPEDENFLAGDAAGNAPFKIKNILVPIDFSPLSKKALQYAVPFSQKYEASLILVHAVEPVPYPAAQSTLLRRALYNSTARFGSNSEGPGIAISNLPFQSNDWHLRAECGPS